MVEHRSPKPRVAGSSPAAPARNQNRNGGSVSSDGLMRIGYLFGYLFEQDLSCWIMAPRPRRTMTEEVAVTDMTMNRSITRLEDIEAIKQLKALYCLYCDDDYDAIKIGSLFTEDGIWDGETRGVYEGRRAIIEFFESLKREITFAVHNVSNPVIEIDGHTATATWNLIQPCTVNGKALWLSGTYNDEYIKLENRWYFKHLRLTWNFRTDYEGSGWVSSF